MSLLRFGGIGDKHLVILHATGLLARMYDPLAAALSQHFVVWGLDLPGHGSAVHACADAFEQHASNADSSSSSSAGNGSLPITLSLPRVVQHVVEAVKAAGLHGCYAFGHSAGGSVALLAASACPGLFSGIFCFEAVVAAPDSHDMINAAAAAGNISTSGSVLTSMALRRRSLFDSRCQAREQLGSKPPFAGLHPRCLELYLQHGLVEQKQKAAPGLVGQPPQQQQQQPVRLLCSPLLEAAYYAALDAPPAVQPSAVTCPVMLAVAAQGGDIVAARFANHGAVQAWALQNQQQQQPGQRQQGGLHGSLAVFNMELAALMPTARLHEVQGVSHFGPLEQPEHLAASCVHFLSTCPYLRTDKHDKLA